MRIIRASEIGAYLYCQRSWWYRINGVEPENKRELQAGTEIHYQHGRAITISLLLRLLSALLLLSAISLFIYSYIKQ